MSVSCNFCTHVNHIWERALPTLLDINTHFMGTNVLDIWKKQGSVTKYVLSCFNNNVELLLDETDSLAKLAQIYSFIQFKEDSNDYDKNFLQEIFYSFLNRHPGGIEETVVVSILFQQGKNILNRCNKIERNSPDLKKLLNKDKFHIEHQKLRAKYKLFSVLEEKNQTNLFDDRLAVLEM